MALHNTDGSLRVATNTGVDTNQDYALGEGIYSLSGGYRVNTTDVGPGLYAADGAYRGTISDSEGAPAAGVGLFQPDGGLRLTSSGSAYYNQPGVVAKDGSLKVTVTNAA